MNWHERYLRQAQWTRELRAYIFGKCGWNRARSVLEVGCGTGAVLLDPTGGAPDSSLVSLHGLDLDPAALTECHGHVPAALLTRGDALTLPYASGEFNITYCHFLLLWVSDPSRALQEMKRVTAASGYVVVLGEPDYSKRVDKPVELAWLGQRQKEALERQGAATGVGARLAELFQHAGIRLIEAGPIRWAGQRSPTEQEWQSEWQVLEADLAQAVDPAEMQHMRDLDRLAWARGDRVLHVPTYFAWGQV